MIQEGNFKRVKYFLADFATTSNWVHVEQQKVSWLKSNFFMSCTHLILDNGPVLPAKFGRYFHVTSIILMVYNISYEEFSHSAITYYLTWHHLICAVCDHIRTEKPPIFASQFRAIVATASVSLFSCLVRYSGSADVS